MKTRYLIPLLIISTPFLPLQALACNPQWGPCAGVVYLGQVGPQTYGQQEDIANQQRSQQVHQWADRNRQIVNSWTQQPASNTLPARRR